MKIDLKKVDKSQLRSSIIQSLEHNTNAVDYVENEINRFNDLLKYREEDVELSRTIHVLEYIKFSLLYLDDCYNKSLKKIGG